MSSDVRFQCLCSEGSVKQQTARVSAACFSLKACKDEQHHLCNQAPAHDPYAAAGGAYNPYQAAAPPQQPYGGQPGYEQPYQQAPPPAAVPAPAGRGAGGPPAPKELREGDWPCPGCGNTNFSFRQGLRLMLPHSLPFPAYVETRWMWKMKARDLCAHRPLAVTERDSPLQRS